jgi:hypothetical protein
LREWAVSSLTFSVRSICAKVRIRSDDLTNDIINPETMSSAIEDGAFVVRIPWHARKEPMLRTFALSRHL